MTHTITDDHRSCSFCDWWTVQDAPAWRRPLLRGWLATRRAALRAFGITDAILEPKPKATRI